MIGQLWVTDVPVALSNEGGTSALTFFSTLKFALKKNSQEALLLYKLSDWLRVWQVDIKESEKRKDEARM